MKEINKIDPNERQGSWVRAIPDKDRWKRLADDREPAERRKKTETEGQLRRRKTTKEEDRY